MADLFLGQTCTYGAKFISAGTAHTFTFPFQVDKVTFYNYTKYGTSDTFVQSVWFKGFPAGDALQIGVGTAPAAKIALEATNGFTVADTSGGVPAFRALISGVSQADPCVVTTSAPNSFQSDQIVRITDLGNVGPGAAARGMDPLNNNRFLITVINSTSFSLRDVITDEPIDSTSFPAWVSGGRCDIESRVITLNNPQVAPYSSLNPYNPNPFEYDPILYKLTAGSAVMGADGDVFYIDAIKFGTYEDLGDLLV